MTIGARRSNFESRAIRLQVQITKLTSFLYNIQDADPRTRYENLRSYRAELFRAFVLSTHLAIEDLRVPHPRLLLARGWVKSEGAPSLPSFGRGGNVKLET